MSQSVFGNVLYSYGYDGELIAYDATTGNILWTWTAPSVGLGETAYPNTPLSWGCAANGTGQTLIYMYSSEHSPNAPLRRDAQIWCINATDGKMLWSLNGWPATAPIIADGRLVYVNCQDMQLYCFGPGLSKTTVSAPQSGISLGSSFTITGTVTDDTPSGKCQGTPAINDVSMDAWMAYLYQQQPFPTNAIGVPVTLDAIDPNGNFVHLGDATSDASGFYSFQVNPDMLSAGPGTYKVIATFPGSNSYGSSYSESALTLNAAPAATAAPTPEPQSIADTYFVPAIAAFFIFVAIIGTARILMLRKRS